MVVLEVGDENDHPGQVLADQGVSQRQSQCAPYGLNSLFQGSGNLAFLLISQNDRDLIGQGPFQEGG